MNEKVKMFISIRKAVALSQLGEQTLRTLLDGNKIDGYKTPSRQRRFNKLSLEKMCKSTPIQKELQRINYIYTRVSSKKQMDNLSRQYKYIISKKSEYINYTSLSDVGSGINFKRKRIQTILDNCLQQVIREVVIAHKDRVSRFGFELLQMLIEKACGKVTVLDNDEHKSTEQELSEYL
jgi:putative resolvase